MTTKRKYKFRIYQDKKNEWRWSLAARNGKIIADSGEGYKRRSSMLRSLNLVRSIDVSNSEVVDGPH